MMKSAVVTTLIALGAIAQTSIRAADEPPEFTGSAFPALHKPSPEVVEFAKILSSVKELDSGSPQKAKGVRLELDEFTRRHPDFPLAYYLRATIDLLIVKGRDFGVTLADIDKAMKLGPEKHEVYFLAECYAMRAKVHYLMGHYQQTVDDLETAIKQNIAGAEGIFGSNGVEPNAPMDLWRLEEVNSLAERFPSDYRKWLIRGLYWKSFTRFSTDRDKAYPVAFREFEKAVITNARSALAHYFLGELYTRMSFWTKEVWSELDSKQRDEDNRRAAAEYSKAIELDPGFKEAYLSRATAYFSRKEFRLAIPDYDKVIGSEPENTTARNDRGLAYLEIGRSMAAVEDLSSAIESKKRKGEADEGVNLESSYEYRADAYAKMGEYPKALADLTEVLRLRLRGHMLLFSMRQFRALYPEYDAFSDEALRIKLSALFWPQRQWEKTILKDSSGEKNEWAIGPDWKELYEKRGNAYLQTGQFPLALKDFRRICSLPKQFSGGPAKKWQPLYLSLNDEDSFLDIETAQSPSRDEWTLAVKTTDKKSDPHPLYQIHVYNIDCRTSYVQEMSRLTYNEDEDVVPNGPDPFGIARMIGQQLYHKACHQ